jgi:hypothetical protein
MSDSDRQAVSSGELETVFSKLATHTDERIRGAFKRILEIAATDVPEPPPPSK